MDSSTIGSQFEAGRIATGGRSPTACRPSRWPRCARPSRRRRSPTSYHCAVGKDAKPAAGRLCPAARPGATFPIVGVGASAGGLEAFTQLLEPSPPTRAWRSSSSSTSIRRTRASCARRWPRPRRCRSASPGRHAPSSRTTSTSSRPTRTSDRRRPADARVARTESAQAAPADRLLFPLARRGPRQPGDRRRPVGDRVGRHRGPAGDQGGGRHHLRAGSRVGEVRRHAAQRGRRRCRRRRAGDPRARPRAGAPEPPPLRGSRRGRRRRPATRDVRDQILDGRAQRRRRRLQRVQAGDVRAAAGPQDGAAPRAGSAGLPGARAR